MKHILFLLLFFMISCGTNLHQYKLLYTDNDERVIKEIQIAFEELVLESQNKKLDYYKLFCVLPSDRYKLSETILLNKERTKFFSVIYKNGSEYRTSDALENIYGIKIKWYFIRGSGLVLPRRYYQYDSYEPMTFEELSYLAHDMRHKHYLKKGKSGKYTVDNQKIERIVSRKNLIWGEDWIEYYNRKMSDTLSTEELKQYEINKAKAEAEFVPKKFPKPKKTPIFETEAWKNRNKKKSKK